MKCVNKYFIAFNFICFTPLEKRKLKKSNRRGRNNNASWATALVDSQSFEGSDVCFTFTFSHTELDVVSSKMIKTKSTVRELRGIKCPFRFKIFICLSLLCICIAHHLGSHPRHHVLHVAFGSWSGLFKGKAFQQLYPIFLSWVNKKVTLLRRKVDDLEFLFGKNRKYSSIVFFLVFPLHCDSDEIFSFSILFHNFRVSMDTFSAPETGVVPLREKSNFSGLLNFSDLKHDWRVLVIRVIQHAIKLLYESQIDLLILIEFESIKTVLVLFGFERNIRVLIV